MPTLTRKTILLSPTTVAAARAARDETNAPRVAFCNNVLDESTVSTVIRMSDSSPRSANGQAPAPLGFLPAGEVLNTTQKPWLVVALLLIATASACDCGGTSTAPPDAGCVAGSAACACDAGACDTGLSCVDDVCVACEGNGVGCPCDAAACADGLRCDEVTATCRNLLTCDTAGCAERQLCDAVAGDDAVCLPACEPGFTFDPLDGSCPGTPSCDPDAPGSIVVLCEAAGRICDDSTLDVDCGDCLPDFVLFNDDCVSNDCLGFDCEGRGRVCAVDPVTNLESCGGCDDSHVLDPSNDTCVDRLTCADSPCEAPTPRCDEATLGSNRVCRAVANCPATQVETAAGACVACTACFSGGVARAGVVGVASDDDGFARIAFGTICPCELQPGFFQTTSDGTVTSCDADGDGWVTDSALTTINQDGGASPLAQEQRCVIRQVDRFELRTDDGAAGNAQSSGGLINVARTKTVTVSEMVDAYQLPATSYKTVDGTRVAQLVEPASLDDPATFTSRYTDQTAAKRLKPFGVGADNTAPFQLTAAEVNPLTKVCNDDNDDLNFDGVKDVLQTHEFSTAPSLRPDLAATPLFYRMAYFMELDRGFFSAACDVTQPDCFGTYVIAEKRRRLVDDDPDGLNLRLSYNDPGGVLGPFGEDPYWEVCLRGREPGYDPGADGQFNTDFSHWYDCDETSGPCHTGSPGYVGYDGRDPGLPNDVRFPADGASDVGRWPGMGHNSQFKCVSFNPNVSDSRRRPPPTPAVPRISTLFDVDSTNAAGDFTLMPCTLTGPNRASHPGIGGIANPRDPVMGCNAAIDATQFGETTSPARHPTQNYFIGLRQSVYDTPGEYKGGCIDEHAEWGFLCLDTPVPNSQRAFGQLFCSCNELSAGLSCEVSCGDERNLSERGVEFGEISGFWMCAGPSVTDNNILHDPISGFRLFGGVPVEQVATVPLCENPGDCRSGFALSAPSY